MHESGIASVIVHSTGGEDTAFLATLGDRVRELRARRGMTRRILATDSGLSERYLAQLEGGQGNVSVLLLRQLARALDVPLPRLLIDESANPVALERAVELRRALPRD